MTSSNITDILNYMALTILLFGPIGNFFVFKIYSSPIMTKTSMSVYFRVISIVDSLNILNLLILYLTQEFDIDLSQSVSIFCSFQNYITYIQTPSTAWIMVIISIDRLCNVAFPRQLPILSNKLFQFFLSLTIILYNYTFYSFIVWNSYLVPLDDTGDDINSYNSTGLNNETMCLQNCNQSVLNWMDLFNSTVCPFVLMLILNSLVVGTLVRSRSRVSNKLSKRDRKFALTVVLLNFIFLTMNLPLAILDLFIVQDNSNMLYYFFLLLYYMYSGIGFYVQLVVNDVFMKRFLDILGLKKVSATDPKTPTMGTTSIM